MGAFAGVTLTGIETELYTGSMLFQYTMDDIFGTAGMIYHAMKPTEVLNQPVVQRGGEIFLADGQDHTTYEHVTVLSDEVPLFDPVKSISTVRYSSTDTRPDLNLVQNIGRQHGSNLARGKTISLICLLAKAAEDYGNVVTCDSDATDGTAPTEIKEGVKTICTNMDEGEVTAGGRHAILRSSAWYDLYDQDGVISGDFGGQMGRQTAGGNGAVINYNNVDIRNCGIAFGSDWTSTALGEGRPDALEHDLTDIIGVFWQEQSWVLREQVAMRGQISEIPERQVWMLLSRYHFGAKVLTGGASNSSDGGDSFIEGVWVLKNASP